MRPAPSSTRTSPDGDSFVTLAALPDVSAATISPGFDGDDPTVFLVARERLWQYRADTGSLRLVLLDDELLPGTTPVNGVAYDTEPGAEGTVVVTRRPLFGERNIFFVGRCAGLSVVEDSATFRMGCTSKRLPTEVYADGIPLRGSIGAGPATLFVPIQSQAWMSLDGGRSFRAVRRDSYFDDWPMDVAALPSPSGESIVLALEGWSDMGPGHWHGKQFARTDDGGRHWTSSFVDVPGFEQEATRVAVTRTGRIILGGHRGGVVCSADGGRTWARTCPRPS